MRIKRSFSLYFRRELYRHFIPPSRIPCLSSTWMESGFLVASELISAFLKCAQSALPKIPRLLSPWSFNISFCAVAVFCLSTSFSFSMYSSPALEAYQHYRTAHKNLTVKYFAASVKDSGLGQIVKGDLPLLTKEELDIVAANPLAFDAGLPKGYKRVFYEQTRPLWEEIYSPAGLTLVVYLYDGPRAKNYKEKLEDWFSIAEMKAFVDGTLTGQAQGSFSKNREDADEKK